MKKQVKIVILVLGVIIILGGILIVSKIRSNNDIEEYQSLWLLYDQNIKNIKNNMDPITTENENFYWWELKNFNLEDKEYQQILNNLVADVRMCYLGYTDDGELYTNSNPIKAYRDRKNITNKELAKLNFDMKNDSCLRRFDRYSGLLISNDKEIRNNLLNKIEEIKEVQKSTLFVKKNLTYNELLSKKIIEVTMVSNLSSWINSEYYRLK